MNQTGQPSVTAILVAAARALGAREPDATVRNPDWLAERLLGPEERTLLGDTLGAALDQPYEAARSDIEVFIVRTLIPRTQFIDSRLAKGIRNGITQVVILGAGFDTRAYRFAEMLKDVHVFEADHPDTQRLKIRRVREAIGEPPANLVYVPIDFRSDNLGDALARAGYRPDRKTFFIWEGMTMYLPEEAVRTTLRWMASNAAPESTIVFDYTYETNIRNIRMMGKIDLDKLPEPAKQAALRFMRLFAGEPWVFGVPDNAEEEFLSGLGLELRKVMGLNSAEAVEKYLTRADGTVFGTFPATGQQGYLILEAAVPGTGL